MLKRFLETKPTVFMFLYNRRAEELTADNFDEIDKMVSILEPFFTLTQRFSSNYATVADVKKI